MRHGLMLWREDELSKSDVAARQACLQAALAQRGLDGLVIYTNHVRSAGVTYVTGFTPYWSDALLFLPANGAPVFATALSKRVGNWIQSTNPTSEVMHSPKPGRLVGERLKADGARRVGVVELSRMPRGLVDEITGAAEVELVDASDLFAASRGRPDAAELALVRKADAIARAAFAEVPDRPLRVGDVAEMLELTVRNAGAEECYVATAPDLAHDWRVARTKGQVELGRTFAVRLSLAYNGVWIRRTETLRRDGDDGDDGRVAEARAVADEVAETLDLDRPVGGQVATATLPQGISLAAWTLEAPVGTRPLEPVAWQGHEPDYPIAYGVLTLRLEVDGAPMVFVRPAGVAAKRTGKREAA